MNETTETAETAYNLRAGLAEDLLKRIAAQLAEHKARQAARPQHWGYAGDLGRVNEELAQVLASLGDRSAVDEPGLKH